MKTPWPHQRTAIDSLKNGSVLVGGTGSGKSLVALGYYYERVLGGSMDPPEPPRKSIPVVIITTARKRDDLDWDEEATGFGISKDLESSINGISFEVDSWNNIQKYKDRSDHMFIFDEQRSVGSGAWAKAFIKIAKKNQWILLSATPADRWVDLIPVFIANGFYKNRTEFIGEHVIYAPFTTFPKIQGYQRVDVLKRMRDKIYVVMPFKKHTTSNVIDIKVEYDEESVKQLNKTEWNPFTDKPIKNLSEHASALRRIINSDPSRIRELISIFKRCKRLIIFYNYNYELEILKQDFAELTTVAEYNGKKHEDVPETESWVYLVQYTSGNEAWECFTTNHMAFYSMNYSYRVTIQSMGRINRLNTPFDQLFYYRLMSESYLDKMILKAFNNKKKFNIRNLKGD